MRHGRFSNNQVGTNSSLFRSKGGISVSLFQQHFKSSFSYFKTRFEKECAEAMLNGRTDVTQSGSNNLVSLESTFKAYESGWQKQLIDV